ncbi:molybdate transport system substrate-binding protein [Dethiosulfatibacter aminovorans DSM 17477]|uniref:Molybdate transport system substrate-binding protein n=1 Tax=Dethiosulfatibacter aminovorans DSM 17477 TaxID=1121476 RepID=A0A1M6MU37_9FIRM|nr:molybdate ABC transporter substrate-binding protein [Dethiosulfatibacter aminovorans]SHJ86899.1 molybdate transport system substrate-binding protein [Dethiosulfatibacter aminovorans DSM 17477]
MNKKRILALVLVLILVLSAMAGCTGSNAADTSGNQDSNDSEENTALVEENTENEAETLIVYCGAGLRKPMDEIAQIYEEKFNVKIEYSYAGSAQNLSQIELMQEGDLYVPGAYSYYESAKEKGFTENAQKVVYHIPVIAVPAGNPANITCLADLANPGVKVVLGDERSAAIGKVSQKILEKSGILEQVEENVVAKDATVNEVLVHVSMKQADACIIWEDNVSGVEEVEIVEITEENNMIKTIPVCVLTFSEKKDIAGQFSDYLVSEEGVKIFEKHGFKAITE